MRGPETASEELKKLRLLLINFEMDPESPVLGWQYRVAVELLRYCERLVVLTERASRDGLHPAMEIHVVPRWMIRAPLRILGAKWLMNVALPAVFAKNSFDACFIHMNMEWAYRLRPCLAWFRVPVVLWYAHGSVSWRLRLAHRFVKRVVTSSPEGFRVASDKVRIIGQGVDTQVYRPERAAGKHTDIVSVGRISRRKRVDLLLQVMLSLREMRPDLPFRLCLVGSALTRDDKDYEAEVRRFVQELGLAEQVEFLGWLRGPAIASLHASALLHLNVSRTGSMDKSLLEALACGCPVLTTNEAFAGLLATTYPEFFMECDHPGELARRVIDLYERAGEFDAAALRGLVAGQHDLSAYVDKVARSVCEVMQAEP